MPTPTTLIRRALIVGHRWLGVVLGGFFFLWFASGIVMMYRTFPAVTPQDRLEHAPVLRAEQVTLSPDEAYQRLGRSDSPAHVVLTSFDGRPVYLSADGMVFADDGTQPGAVDGPMVDRAAAMWAKQPIEQAIKESVEATDQWTISGPLRHMRPLYKYSWPDGQQVYVSGETADVVQYTTTASRFWAYLGAIPHWLYFTPLRLHQEAWYRVVFWSSLTGAAASFIGIVLAVWTYSPRQRYRHEGAPSRMPYRGWKRWHAITGLVVGVFAITWTLSGLLSMGPFEIMNTLAELTVREEPADAEAGRGDVDMSDALLGGRLAYSAYAGRSPAAAIAAVPDFAVKELEYVSFAREPLYLATGSTGDTRLIPVSGAPRAMFDADDLMRRMRKAGAAQFAELRLIHEYDAYYLDRHRLRPLPVIYARMNDAVNSRFYIDPRTASIVGGYTARDWVDRWLYHGLHSLDFPWLINHRPLWDIVMISLMLGGTALCVTSLVLAWRVLIRQLAAVGQSRVHRADDDLVPQSSSL